MGKKIAVLVTDMVEDSEYTEPVKAYKEAGHEIVNIEKEKGKTVKGKHGDAVITIDESIDNAKVENYDALLIPGGFSPDILRADDRFVQFVKDFMDSKNRYLRFAMVHSSSSRRKLWKEKRLLAINPFVLIWNTPALIIKMKKWL